MIKDKDLYRSLLIELEQLEMPFKCLGIHPTDFSAATSFSEDQILMHLIMMIDEGQFIDSDMLDDGFLFNRLSPRARDFLDAFRDDNNWNEAKRLSQKAGGWTVELLLDIGKSILKKKIEEATGGIKLPI